MVSYESLLEWGIFALVGIFPATFVIWRHPESRSRMLRLILAISLGMGVLAILTRFEIIPAHLVWSVVPREVAGALVTVSAILIAVPLLFRTLIPRTALPSGLSSVLVNIATGFSIFGYVIYRMDAIGVNLTSIILVAAVVLFGGLQILNGYLSATYWKSPTRELSPSPVEPPTRRPVSRSQASDSRWPIDGQEAFTGAILLGASTFPLHSYGPNKQFLKSKQDLSAYLRSATRGLGVQRNNLLDLFDSSEQPGSQLVAIGEFLDRLVKETDSHTVRNLIIYYVGHGLFPGRRNEYHLALACTKTQFETSTALRIAALGDVLKHHAKSFRRFVILDACFAEEALTELQGPAQDAIARKADVAFEEDGPKRQLQVPRCGTALLCASDKDSVARSPKGLSRTMFCEALIDVLEYGDPDYPFALTLSHVTELAWERLRTQHDDPVRPVLHSPDQTEGDIATRVPLFPNAARMQ